MTNTIGIDLGTCNSAAATMIDGKIRLIPPSDGPTPQGNLFPSTVAFREDGAVLVGKKAETYSYTCPDRVVKWIKRKMGTKCKVDINGHEYTPQEISAIILSRIRDDAEKYLGEKIEKAVITAPAYFNNNQRNATKKAGELAGFDVLRIISEPTAASLAYGLDKVKRRLKIAVLDLGAGTFDVSVLHTGDGIFKVISTSGDTELGGKDIDDRILNHIVKRFEQEYRVDLRDKGDLNRLRALTEKAKIELSTKPLTTINISIKRDGSKLHLQTVLTRKTMENLIGDIIVRLRDPLENALKDAYLSPHDIDRLVLVGGPTRMPIVWNYFRKFFGIEPEKGFHPMEIVAVGAFVHASILSGEIRNLILMDVTPLSLGIETSCGLFTRLIKRNTAIPIEESRVFATEEDYQTSMVIHILQGERTMAYNNVSLGLFKLDGIPPAPRYEQEVKVIFRIDADGILNVKAKILTTGKKQEITVTEATTLTEEEVVRKILEASRFGDEDEKKKRSVEARNRIRAVLYALNQLMMKVGKELSEHERKRLRELLKKMREGMSSNNHVKIMKNIDSLTEFMDGVKSRGRKVKQARMLSSFIKTSLKEKITLFDEKKLDAVIAKLDKVDDVEVEINKLKEMIILSEANYGGK